MAKAVFHKHQRVYVEPVGTWAIIEHVKPQWAKGVDEPIRIHYDVGLGRDFQAGELRGEESGDGAVRSERVNWRVVRGRNRFQEAEDCAHHPVPGTYPIVVTDEREWGGWRVSGQEYDRDPLSIEYQARLFASANRLLHIARRIVETAERDAGEVPDDVLELAREAKAILRHVHDRPSAAPAAAA